MISNRESKNDNASPLGHEFAKKVHPKNTTIAAVRKQSDNAA